MLSRRSGNDTPTRCTCTRTSSRPGVGSATSRTSTSDGPVAVMTWAARMGGTLPGGRWAGPRPDRCDRWDSARGDQPVHLEVHGVGVVPGAAPGEAPLLEDGHHLAVDLADGSALVLRDVDVEGQSEGVVGQRRGAGDETRDVATAVLPGVDRR